MHECQAKRLRLNPNSKECGSCEIPSIFEHFRIYILPTGIGKFRCSILRKQTEKFGGVIDDRVTSETTHIIVDETVSVEKLCKVLNWQEFPPHVKIVKTLWLSNCIKLKTLVATENFEINSTFREMCGSIRKESSISGHTSGSLVTFGDDCLPGSETPSEIPFMCAISSNQHAVNYNKHVTDKLEVLSKFYKSTGDHWRAVGYEKAIIALKNHPKSVTTWEEAKAIRGIGERLADKISEILQSGHLRKIDETCFEKRNSAVTLFMKVWGIGSNTAQSFVQQGFYTLDDLRTKANLTKSQHIGLKYFDELQERMSRNEASELFSIVEKQVKTDNPDILAVACGSYRRNRETCGDLDVLITDPKGPLQHELLSKVVSNLHDIGFLTDDLVSLEENGDQKKYMGICKLPGVYKKHRRIDIIVVPHEEYACALMHFTGSAYFNRSIRLFAKKKNMSLSEHSLRAGIVREGSEKITEGYALCTPTEESIFEHLGLEFKKPDERDHFAVE